MGRQYFSCTEQSLGEVEQTYSLWVRKAIQLPLLLPLSLCHGGPRRYDSKASSGVSKLHPSLGLSPWNSLTTQPANLGICFSILHSQSLQPPPTPPGALPCSSPTAVALSISPSHCRQEADRIFSQFSQPVVGADPCNKMKALLRKVSPQDSGLGEPAWVGIPIIHFQAEALSLW